MTYCCLICLSVLTPIPHPTTPTLNPTPTHLVCPIYASVNWASIGSGNGLAPNRRQTMTWANTDLLSIGALGTNYHRIRIKIQNFSFVKLYLKTLSVKWRPFCPVSAEIIKKYPYIPIFDRCSGYFVYHVWLLLTLLKRWDQSQYLPYNLSLSFTTLWYIFWLCYLSGSLTITVVCCLFCACPHFSFLTTRQILHCRFCAAQLSELLWLLPEDCIYVLDIVFAWPSHHLAGSPEQFTYTTLHTVLNIIGGITRGLYIFFVIVLFEPVTHSWFTRSVYLYCNAQCAEHWLLTV